MDNTHLFGGCFCLLCRDILQEMAPRSSRQTVSVYKALLRLGRSFSIVIGLVMIWRGIWYVLDSVDAAFFAGDYRWTAVGGILLGLVLLYLPDGDLKELDKL